MSIEIYLYTPHFYNTVELYSVEAMEVWSVDYIDWFYHRLTELRMARGVSARDMSLSLGQSESYINKIENRRTLPSFTGFLYICDYFQITPEEFFNQRSEAPDKTRELLRELEKLTPEQTVHILQIVKDITER